MAWFYNGKQVYKAWTDFGGTTHPATWYADWSEQEKLGKGLVQKGTINSRFFNDDESAKAVADVKASEVTRMQGLLAQILSETQTQIISESDGEELESIPSEITAKRDEATASSNSAQTLINAETTFDSLYDLIERSTKTVYGIKVPSATGNWGTDEMVIEVVNPSHVDGVISRRAKQNEFITE